ncbi:GNAT family N-acetyltransferase [Streptomyces sp. V4-01]|uniref:GNAT family N-acetyltransferase n=1 Tax=Actinacidiphila polyblastidii TaxID=3110430 RepID=A0ABU7PEB7_9ACTN|nr:GNAT family N-acetyltransferase [Streptomyces sp. V4-01]
MSTPHTLIRPAGTADLDAICDVHARARATYYAGHLPPEAYSGPAELDRQRTGTARAIASPERIVLCAERDGRIVGFAALAARFDGDRLFHFHVDPEVWRTGAGAALHRACVGAWQAAGLATARLEVFAPNARARAFYAAQGWVEHSCEGDHVVMELALRADAPAAEEPGSRR